ncbi:hypothetical protein V8C42DRAFT_303477 [Trichoderma barbatum]
MLRLPTKHHYEILMPDKPQFATLGAYEYYFVNLAATPGSYDSTHPPRTAWKSLELQEARGSTAFICKSIGGVHFGQSKDPHRMGLMRLVCFS